jgi:aminoglycoside 6'-N-acetyltransferase
VSGPRPPDQPILGEQVVLRRATADDVEEVFAILSTPEVARWWPGETLASVRDTLTSRVPHEQSFVIEHEGTAIGIIQCAEELEPEYRHAGIDVALHPAWHGRGLGTDAVRTLARHLFEGAGHHRVTIDPAADNHRAIRCYEKVGFRRVGVMRKYERGPDGTFHDGLLMDLLPDDLSDSDARG